MSDETPLDLIAAEARERQREQVAKDQERVTSRVQRAIEGVTSKLAEVVEPYGAPDVDVEVTEAGAVRGEVTLSHDPAVGLICTVNPETYRINDYPTVTMVSVCPRCGVLVDYGDVGSATWQFSNKVLAMVEGVWPDHDSGTEYEGRCDGQKGWTEEPPPPPPAPQVRILTLVRNQSAQVGQGWHRLEDELGQLMADGYAITAATERHLVLVADPKPPEDDESPF